MNQSQRRQWLIRALLQERQKQTALSVPAGEEEQRRLLRGLMNVRPAAPLEDRFFQIQDEYLQEELQHRNVTDITSLSAVEKGIYLWRGDITTLRCDGIVNAANSGMTGCYEPCHNCIDNCIHTYAGIQLRLECAQIMAQQGHPEPTGTAKITKAYNLPCKYVLHTVGPIVRGRLNQQHCQQLAGSYRSCLQLAEEHGLQNLAFCCISTGVFGFPAKEAARIAVDTVREYQKNSSIQVIFNVFSESDERIYQNILQGD